MAIIDHTYFQLPPLAIPNAVQGVSIRNNNELPNNIVRLNAVIDRVEYDMLLNALGYEQYTELMTQFEENGDWKESALQKWKDLVDGKEEWKGLRFTIGTNKMSLIAYYVYYRFLAQSETYFTTTGLVSNRGENASKVNPDGHLCNMWNAFVYMYQGGYDCGCINLSWLQDYNEPYEYSLLQYLNANTDTYNNQFFKVYTYKNLLGI